MPGVFEVKVKSKDNEFCQGAGLEVEDSPRGPHPCCLHHGRGNNSKLAPGLCAQLLAWSITVLLPLDEAIALEQQLSSYTGRNADSRADGNIFLEASYK